MSKVTLCITRSIRWPLRSTYAFYGKKTITKEMLYTYAMPVNALKMLIEEIEQGEDLFEENEKDRMGLLYKIGLKARGKEKRCNLKKWRRKA
ncbi:hypothetical protein [Bacillus sp. NPDC094077]|uniref:hypothetical protein n=1 Tax=Bacillus sp. NPDC094077 TaxID=3390932 RepID=UPI003D021143